MATIISAMHKNMPHISMFFFLLSLVFPVPLYFCDFIRNLLEYYAHKDETFLL